MLLLPVVFFEARVVCVFDECIKDMESALVLVALLECRLEPLAREFH